MNHRILPPFMQKGNQRPLISDTEEQVAAELWKDVEIDATPMPISEPPPAPAPPIQPPTAKTVAISPGKHHTNTVSPSAPDFTVDEEIDAQTPAIAPTDDSEAVTIKISPSNAVLGFGTLAGVTLQLFFHFSGLQALALAPVVLCALIEVVMVRAAARSRGRRSHVLYQVASSLLLSQLMPYLGQVTLTQQKQAIEQTIQAPPQETPKI